MASSDRQIDKPQRGRPKRAELPDVNINTDAQSINTERTSLRTTNKITTDVARLDHVFVANLSRWCLQTVP